MGKQTIGPREQQLREMREAAAARAEAEAKRAPKPAKQPKKAKAQ